MADFERAAAALARSGAALELMRANAVTARYGLALSPGQIGRILNRRDRALLDAGRMEFGGGILCALVEAFCDSPYIRREEYEETICELIDSFYYLRNEADGLIPDEALIENMRLRFDEARGSLERLNGATLGEVLRGWEEEAPWTEE